MLSRAGYHPPGLTLSSSHPTSPTIALDLRVVRWFLPSLHTSTFPMIYNTMRLLPILLPPVIPLPHRPPNQDIRTNCRTRPGLPRLSSSEEDESQYDDSSSDDTAGDTNSSCNTDDVSVLLAGVAIGRATDVYIASCSGGGCGCGGYRCRPVDCRSSAIEKA